MIYSDDGKIVTLTLAEYGELKGAIQKVERESALLVLACQESKAAAQRLLSECMNKEANMRYQLDIKNVLNQREEAAAQVVRMAEGFMREVYHTMAGVSRIHRTELENKMKQLRGY